MKLIVDIHEKDYKSILNRRYVSTGAVDAIMHGTPLNEVFDKIRIEIASYGTNSGMLLALEIIDKYRGEADCHSCKIEYDCYECKKYTESEKE